MGLTIDQTYAAIGIEREPGRVEIHSQGAKVELHQKHARINIHTEPIKVEIDQYEARASAGLKNNYDLSRETVRNAYQQVMEYIGKKASDGDMLARIQRGGNPIADIAARDAFPQHEFGYDYIPKVRPKFDVTGSVTIDPERNSEGIHNGVEATIIEGFVNINYTPGKVNIYMRQYASVDIKYQEENKIDTYI